MTITLVSPPVRATETAFMAHIPHMRAFARILTGDAARADDLVEAAIRRAGAAPEPALPAGGMLRWMFTLLHVLHYGAVDGTRATAAAGAAGTRQPNQSIDNFACAFWQLRDDQREVLILEAATGMSRADVAAIYGGPPGMVALRGSMARQNLLATLQATTHAERARVAATVIDYADALAPTWPAANRA